MYLLVALSRANIIARRRSYCKARYLLKNVFISIIIPTLNEATTIKRLAATLARLRGEFEVIIADGGSTDETIVLAQQCGLRVIKAPRGRGQQMNAGAQLAHGEALLFLHADTHLPDDALKLIAATLRNERVGGGNFSLLFGGASRAARALTRVYPFLRLGGMCYGDSGIFVRRSLFAALGGYRNDPLFEDCDLYQRLKRRAEFVRLPAQAVTSARRFEGRFLRTFALWSLLQALYWLGVPPQTLNRLYKPRR